LPTTGSGNRPEMAETLNNRGNALYKLNLHVEALATFGGR
jgi:hypothetical protein